MTGKGLTHDPDARALDRDLLERGGAKMAGHLERGSIKDNLSAARAFLAAYERPFR